jgi:hypothetical protein
MNFQKADYVRFAKLESSIQHAVSGIDPKDFFSVWKNRLLPMSNMSHVVIERDKEIANLHQNIMALHNSTSWRITAPLRYIAERIKKLTGY